MVFFFVSHNFAACEALAECHSFVMWPVPAECFSMEGARVYRKDFCTYSEIDYDRVALQIYYKVLGSCFLSTPSPGICGIVCEINWSSCCGRP